MSRPGDLLGAVAPRAAATWRLFRRLGSRRARSVFLRQEFGRRLLGRRERLPRIGAEARILFVCHGNIMRSALAEVALRSALGACRFQVASAGTQATPGNPADPRALAYAAAAGLDLSRHQARVLDLELGLSSGVIFTLDRRIQAEVAALDPALGERTLLLGGITPAGGYPGNDIDDPYTLAADRATRSFDQVMQAVGIVAERLRTAGVTLP
jgi:low molecular weight protein-tyrosine phosphatase